MVSYVDASDYAVGGPRSTAGRFASTSDCVCVEEVHSECSTVEHHRKGGFCDVLFSPEVTSLSFHEGVHSAHGS